MKPMRILAICLSALLLGACGTQPKIYKAPSDAKVKAATVDLNVKVTRARETARKAKQAAEEAKALHERAVKRAGTIKELLVKLALEVPEQYKGPIRQVTDSLDQLIADNEELDNKLKEVVAWNLQLQVQLVDAEKARVTLQAAQDDYAFAAADLARDATNERNERIKVEKQLSKEKIIRLLWKIGGGFAVAAILVVIGLWLFGKLGWAGAKIASKFT